MLTAAACIIMNIVENVLWEPAFQKLFISGIHVSVDSIRLGFSFTTQKILIEKM